MFKLGRIQEWKNQNKLHQIKPFKIIPRQLQQAIINCSMTNDVIVNLPTAYGKSLLYQYPAFYSSKITIVFVPLKSLLFDSLIEAEQLNIAAAQISQNIVQQILKSTYQLKILFLTPQKLMANNQILQGLIKLQKNKRIQKFVIDESHCISEWGNDFRPAYGQLSILKKMFPKIKILAMTATNPPQIRGQIIKKLNIQNCYLFQTTYNRVNLYYQVRKINKKSLISQIQSIIYQNGNGQDAGIIYCQTIKLAQEIFQKLRSNNFSCQLFHSKISDKNKQKILIDFKNNKCKLLIATISFGMGINKSNIKYIIHAGISLNIENYYQQSGRAGRNGERANCILLYIPQELSKLNYLIMKDGNSQRKNVKLQKLQMMRKYTQSQICRRTQMFKYLGEQFESQKCNYFCDNCNKKQQQYIQIDFTEKGNFILQNLRLQIYNLTKKQLINYLHGGTKAQKTKYFRNNNLYGYLKSQKMEQIQFYIQNLVKLGYLIQNYIKIKFGVGIYLKVNPSRTNLNKILFKKQKVIKNQCSKQRISYIQRYLAKKKQKQLKLKQQIDQNISKSDKNKINEQQFELKLGKIVADDLQINIEVEQYKQMNKQGNQNYQQFENELQEEYQWQKKINDQTIDYLNIEQQQNMTKNIKSQVQLKRDAPTGLPSINIQQKPTNLDKFKEKKQFDKKKYLNIFKKMWD